MIPTSLERFDECLHVQAGTLDNQAALKKLVMALALVQPELVNLPHQVIQPSGSI
ncbi:hypothetical protein MJ581_10325 [Escherichia coli]|nr:hypothetical protein MJ581_10325 [Escherichia coli]